MKEYVGFEGESRVVWPFIDTPAHRMKEYVGFEGGRASSPSSSSTVMAHRMKEYVGFEGLRSRDAC